MEDSGRPLLWRGDCVVEVVEPDQLLVLSEDRYRLFNGRAFAAAAPLLDGTRGLDEVCAVLADRVPLAESYFALGELGRSGLLSRNDPDGPAGAWCDAAGLDQAGLRATRVRVLAGRSEEAEAFEEALARSGVAIADGEADLSVVLVDDILDPRLEAINAARLADGRPWLVVKPAGRPGWVGPLFAPGDTACWACLAHRVREARQAETWIGRLRRGPAPTAPPSGTATTRDLCRQIAVAEVLSWIGGRRPGRLFGRILTVDAADLSTRLHEVVRRPQCKACGTPDLACGTLDLACGTPVPHPLARTAPGGEPTALWEPDGADLDRFVDEITGVVQRVEPGLESPNPLVHTAIAVHFFPMFKDDLKVLQRNLIGRGGGKGRTPAQARCGAIGEALERHAGIWQGDVEPVLRSSARRLGAAALHPSACLLFSDAQLEGRRAWNRALRSPHQVVTEPLDPDDEIDWTPARSLTHDEIRYLPAAYCWYGHPELARMICLADSNGCAAAGAPDRAVLAGLVELIERDAVAIWWYNRLSRPAVDLASFGDPYIDDLCRRYRDLGREIWAIDVGADLGVPVIVALSARTDRAAEDVIFGFGASLDAPRAVLRALTELNQSYGFVSATEAEGRTQYRAENAEMLDWLRSATRASQPYLVPDPALPPRRAADFPAPPWEDAGAAVRGLVARLGEAGLEAFLVDQTRPDIGLPVARVVVPGLRHMWRRLAPGRLYDVPVALGWLDAPRAEADLNPYSIFI
ncbi:ribosomal protein S12 methylthiotransferase accessory factor [Methylobacterium sp. 174MFSha1.1]|uniref:TOMM precursor leader peptide-binding protein n=1 Tax=Methylobacterium sp. 174MFSha1.1 TaxID=1502749 RepID=UPI0008E3613E|nr:TOMM precursor leader peptide-binding protein [Methylobacterium sp. 174MFSha1.1]SFU76590.1 ribosomal protein S12 methylthiotransferase accessory factor [Methylobacterium sp. 174MFSha1.1]